MQFMDKLSKNIVLFDTEYTAWEGSQESGWSRSNEYKEIVQIGGIILETQNFTKVSSFNVYVKPIFNPVLSEYFINLTAITQEVVERRGIDLISAYAQFVDWSVGIDSYSFGHDEKVIIENFDLLNKSTNFQTQRFFNARNLFEENNIDTKNYCSGNIIEYFGKKTTLRAHDALNDSRIMAEALREMILNSNKSR